MNFDDSADMTDAEKREEQRLDRLRTRNSKCFGCEERRSVALPSKTVLVCYECRARLRGKRSTEAHHAFGRRNDGFTVDVPINDHRHLSDMQNDWPGNLLRNPDQSPLLRMAAQVQGLLNVLKLILDYVAGALPEGLVALDAWLCERLGDNWWEEWGWSAA